MRAAKGHPNKIGKRTKRNVAVTAATAGRQGRMQRLCFGQVLLQCAGVAPASAGGGGNGTSLVATHHAGRNGSAPNRCPYSAAAAGGLVATGEQWSGNANPPRVDVVEDNNVGGCGDGGGNNDSNCPDNDSNGSIQEDDRGSNYKTDLLG